MSCARSSPAGSGSRPSGNGSIRRRLRTRRREARRQLRAAIRADRERQARAQDPDLEGPDPEEES